MCKNGAGFRHTLREWLWERSFGLPADGCAGKVRCPGRERSLLRIDAKWVYRTMYCFSGEAILPTGWSEAHGCATHIMLILSKKWRLFYDQKWAFKASSSFRCYDDSPVGDVSNGQRGPQFAAPDIHCGV